MLLSALAGAKAEPSRLGLLSIEMASALSAWLWHISALEPWLYVEPNGSKWLWGYLYGHPKVSVDQKTYFLEMF